MHRVLRDIPANQIPELNLKVLSLFCLAGCCAGLSLAIYENSTKAYLSMSESMDYSMYRREVVSYASVGVAVLAVGGASLLETYKLLLPVSCFLYGVRIGAMVIPDLIHRHRLALSEEHSIPILKHF